jgi:hypothetical protein
MEWFIEIKEKDLWHYLNRMRKWSFVGWEDQRHAPVTSAAPFAVFLMFLASGYLVNPGYTALRPPVAIPEYSLEVTFDLPRGKIRGRVVIQAPPGQKLVIDPGDLILTKIEELGRREAIRHSQEGDSLILFPQGPILLSYVATLKNFNNNRINEREVFLQGMWYPQVEGFCRFKLTAMLPAGFVAVSEADYILKEEQAGQVIFHFDFPYPVYEADGITLVASNRFVTSHATFKHIEIWTYLLPEEAPLASDY